MSTIADVAARAGVSKATASRALSGSGYVASATRERVQLAAMELSYVAHSSATSLATGRTRTVGVIMPTADRWYFVELLAGIQQSLVERGLDLSLYSAAEGGEHRNRTLDHALSRRRFDGLIAVCVPPGTAEAERLATLDLPTVAVGPRGTDAMAAISTVSIDDAAAARVVTEHLLDLGHRDIAFLGGVADPERPGIGDEIRAEGYREAMSSAGLSERIRTVRSGSTLPEAFLAAAELLGDRRHRPTAIVGVCDEAAIGAIIAARRLGISVPTELSVIGIDDHQYAEMFALTTMRQLPRAQGEEAVRLLQARLEDPSAPVPHVLSPISLVVRSSTAAPRD